MTTFGSQIETEGSLKIQEAILKFLAQNILKETANVEPQMTTVDSSKVE